MCNVLSWHNVDCNVFSPIPNILVTLSGSSLSFSAIITTGEEDALNCSWQGSWHFTSSCRRFAATGKSALIGNFEHLH